jgi:hypothetical protein
MAAGCKPSPTALALVFERDGEPTIRIEVGGNGEKAVLRAVGFLLQGGRLQVGDRLSVIAAADDG